MRTVTAVEARKGLGRLLNLVSLKRETIAIERAGKKLAVLKPYESEADDANVLPQQGRLSLLDLSGLGSEIWAGVDVDDYLFRERDQWT